MCGFVTASGMALNRRVTMCGFVRLSNSQRPLGRRAPSLSNSQCPLGAA